MSINIRIHGAANMGAVTKELARVTATAKAMNSEFVRSNAALAGDAGRQVANYRQTNSAMSQMRDTMNDLTRANGQFAVSSMKVGNQSDAMIERIQKQQLSLSGLRKEFGAVEQAYRRHQSIQRSTAMTWGTTAAGSMHVDLLTPNDIQKSARSIDDMRHRLGFYREVLGSVSTQTINWGKNTQWAGRQLMAGFTYPMVIAAGLTAKAAYDIDKGLTQIVKVYGDAGDAMQATDEQIKSAAMSTAKNLTQYGQSATETLEIQSQLASTGKTGRELQEATKAVTKARLLGELDIQDAMKATITMQEVYGFGADKLAEKFNFMNQMENETSLTMQDFVEGIPKISGIMKSLDADFEDTGVLLAAMKTAGIDAKEGGNAIKSMVFKDIAPSAKALRTFSEMTGSSLAAIVDTTKGDPIKTLQGIGEAIEDLPGEDKVAVIKEVFGIHQGSKALGMITALTEQSGQMTKAFEISNMSAEQWATTASGELSDLKNADWVRAKAGIENVKIAAAELGRVILRSAIPVIEFLGDKLAAFAAWFDKLPDSTKNITMTVLAVGALAGPLIMMAGLAGNLIGQMMNLTRVLTGPLAKGGMLLTAKQKAQKIATDDLTSSLNQQTMAYANLHSAQNDVMMTQYRRMNPMGANAVAIGAPTPTGGKMTGSNNAFPVGSMGRPAGVGALSTKTNGQSVNALPGFEAINAGKVELANKIDKAAGRTAISWAKIGTHTQTLGFAAGAMGAMVADSSSVLYYISNAAMAAALVGPALIGAVAPFAKKLKVSMTGAIASVAASSAMAKFGGKFAAAGVAIKGFGASLAAMAGPIGIIAVGLGAIALYAHKQAKEAKARQDALNDSLKTTGELLGFATEEAKRFKVGSEKNKSTDYMALAKEMKEENKDLADAIDHMKESSKEVGAAVAAGIRHGQEGMIKYGWSKEEAMEAARVYATAINKKVASTVDKTITLKPFLEIKDVQVEVSGRVRDTVADAIKGGTNELGTKRVNDFSGEGSIVGGQAGNFSGVMSAEAKKEIKTAVENAYDVFAQLEGAERNKMFQSMGEDAYSGMTRVFNQMSTAQKDALEDIGVIDAQTMAEYAEKNGPAAIYGHLAKTGNNLTPEQMKNLKRNFDALEQVLMSYIMATTDKTEKEIKKEFPDGLFNFDNLVSSDAFEGSKKLQKSDAFVTRQTSLYEAEVRKATKARGELSYEEQRAILNKHRLKAGLEETTVLADGMNRKISASTIATQKETDAITKNNEARSVSFNLRATAYNASDRSTYITGEDDPAAMTAMVKESMAAAQDTTFKFALDTMAQEHEGRLDAIDRDAESRSAAFDREEELKEAAFDKRQESIESAFDTREKKFESRWEKTMDNFESAWEDKSDRFEAKWDKTMDNFEDSAKKAKKAVEAQYDSRIKKIEDAIEAERRAEEVRQAIFEKEKARMQHLASLANSSIDINMAINSGDLDEAARISNDAQASIDSFAMDSASDASQSGSDQRINELEGRKSVLEKKKDSALEQIEERMEARRKELEHQRKMAERAFEEDKKQNRKRLEEQREFAAQKLKEQRQDALKSLEEERKAYAKSLAASKKAYASNVADKKRSETAKYNAARETLERELEVLKMFPPRSRAELQAHMKKIDKIYATYGTSLKTKGEKWSRVMGNAMDHETRKARAKIQSDRGWESMGRHIATAMTKGTFKMTLNQFMKWIGKGAPYDSMPGGYGKNAASGKGNQTGAWKAAYRHKGGILDGTKGSRAGFSGTGNSQSEMTITALKGESVLNRQATRALGAGGINALNRGQFSELANSPQGTSKSALRGQIGDSTVAPGFAGLIGMMGAGIAGAIVNSQIHNLGVAKMASESAFGSLSSGKYGNSNFGAEQMKNASIIASVGKGLGASTRDIIIALMTAMQESTLRNINYGDRDSLGLFQQRAPWGSAADRTNPAKAARMFFLGGMGGQPGLFDKKNRGDMSLTQAAQAVQVSAFPNAYAQWEDEARAMMEAMTWQGKTAMLAGSGGGNVWAGMGWQKQWDIVRAAFPDAIKTSDKRNWGTGSYHDRGRAIDVAYATTASGMAKMDKVFNWIYSNFGSKSTELIWAPQQNRNIKNGRHMNYGPDVNAIHYNHVHWAMRNGGVVPGRGAGDRTPVMAEPGEFMLKKKAVSNVGIDYLKMLNSDRFINMPRSAVASAATGAAAMIDNSSRDEYNIRIDARGNDNASEIANEVKKVLFDIQNRKGFNRKVGSN